MLVKELIKELLDCDQNSNILIQTECFIQGRKITIESNNIKDIKSATGKYPKTYTIIGCNFMDKQ